MSYVLSATYKGERLFSSPINTVFGRTLVLFSLTLPDHLRKRPQDASVTLAAIARTIEDALQENLEAHALWLRLSNTSLNEPVMIDVVSQLERVQIAADLLSGGDGGDGAWPAGGGGGGGGGSGLCGRGGNGADGAAILFELDAAEQLIGIETFVMPGSFDWVCPPGVDSVIVGLFGAGGGGAGAAPRLP